MSVAKNSVAWERINALFDKGSFSLMDQLDPTIHILGQGTVNNRLVYCCAGVPEIGSAPPDMLACFNRKITWLNTILKEPAPVLWLHDSPPQTKGGRTPIPKHSDDLLASGNGVGRAFCLQARLSEKVVQFSVLFGDVGAAQTFPFRLADFTLVKEGTHAWIGRPDAVKLMLGTTPDAEELGGARMHCSQSGAGDFMFKKDRQAFDWIKRCLDCFPSMAGEPLPIALPREPEFSCADLKDLIPDDLNKPFDMTLVLKTLADQGSWAEYQGLYAPEALTGFAKIHGIPLGICANNSIHKGGIIFPESCAKMSRFIKLCDTYHLPMVFLVDNPGLMVGVSTEQAGMLVQASGLLKTLALSSTPKACLVIRKAYTVGLYAMSGPGFDPACFWAAPNASISVFGPKALDRFAKDQDLPKQALEAIDEMRHHALHPQDYAEKGYLDGILEWGQLRSELIGFANKSMKNSISQSNRRSGAFPV